MDFKDKKVLVLGYSITGVSAAKYLAKNGANVFLSEVKEKTNQNTKELVDLGIKIEFKGHSEDFIKDAAFAILSPSIPPKTPILEELRKRGIEYMSDVEFAYRLFPKKILTITGTNGKTTTTMLTDFILSSKYKTTSCGNIGKSPCDFLDCDYDYLVCETSSYQLEYSNTLAPHIAAFTNLTPDHIGFHGNLENYFEAKAKMFRNMKENDFAVLNYDDLKLRELSKEIKAKTILFSTSDKADICMNGNYIEFLGEKVLSLDDIKMPGNHNIQNVMCAIAFAKLLNIENKKIQEKVREFRAPEHRCEFVCKIGKTAFYNDSKATNPEASMVALNAFPKKTVSLIAGGRDKNTTLAEFCDYVNKYIDNVVLIGEATERFEDELQKSGFRNIIKGTTLEDAVDKAIKTKTDIVLLSPACASFDMFNSFEHRGEVFKEYVLSKTNK